VDLMLRSGVASSARACLTTDFASCGFKARYFRSRARDRAFFSQLCGGRSYDLSGGFLPLSSASASDIATITSFIDFLPTANGGQEPWG
jgi:hypothetical protein